MNEIEEMYQGLKDSAEELKKTLPPEELRRREQTIAKGVFSRLSDNQRNRLQHCG